MNGKSLACWLMVATICPQVLIVSPSHTEVVSEVASRITDINTTTSGDRLNLVLNFAGSDRPQITYRSQGKSWIAELNGAQLQLGNGNASFAKTNPAPGISAIEATQIAANKVNIRMTVTDPDAFKSSIIRRDTSSGVMFSVATAPSADKKQDNQNNLLAQVPTTSKPQVPSQATTRPVTPKTPEALVTTSNSQLSTEPTTEVISSSTDSKTTKSGQVVFQPQLSITGTDGKTRVAQTTVPPDPQVPPAVVSPVQPQLPGRTQGVVPPFRKLTTPPVGDIATSTSTFRPDSVDLGSAERVPRLTLKNAPAVEVLTLIARIAGLSVYPVADDAAGDAVAVAAATPGTTGTGLNKPVSLDVENQTAQDVFNDLLRSTGLQASRLGNRVFVGIKLPVSLRNIVTKSYRLNQISVGEATAFLIGLGGERVVNRLRPIPGIDTATIGSTATNTTVTVPTESVPVLESITATPTSKAPLVLRGVQVIGEERSNSVTLVGPPNLVAYAEAQLARLDIRKRQVVVNVKVVEVRLQGAQTFASSIGFNASNTDGGGTRSTALANNGNLFLDFNNALAAINPQQFIANLNFSITSNNGKILTDPSITVQEGEKASIALTESVATKSTVTPAVFGQNGNVLTPATQTVTVEDVGLALNIQIDRIDDNGFVSLSVSPNVTAPNGDLFPRVFVSGLPVFGIGLSKRTLNSGRVRMRDGQTLILSGIIRDQDSQALTKVPILGDLPIIGALFRQEVNTNSRSEIVVTITPRIIDDSERANWGYTYQPGSDVQKVLDSNRIKPQ
ncbi:secretin and TonB N-terminal domain-containing protein [Tumidithrix elongata RA019]|uniref:Secretin and TonB N-terminal domain-containing protein n=1 Tax=Tumidithrix elongata BACA0141 TaxID=2716417 RepID=A0AAW9PT83_9CYAN|nr:secretin and TonB N-terminal domain-containing protein [Tumidithrix elongata RA019]